MVLLVGGWGSTYEGGTILASRGPMGGPDSYWLLQT